MDESVLEIREYTGTGYKPLIDYADWRVAILNFLNEVSPELNKRMERHTETDEVFVLTRGKAVLVMGGNNAQADEVSPQSMEIGKLYNIKRNAWHTILMSRDASVLLVENKDTGDHNSEFFDLTDAMHSQVLEIAKTHAIE